VHQDVPKVLKGKAWPALVATGRVMGMYGVTFAAIGGIFAAVDVRAPRRKASEGANPRPVHSLRRPTRARRSQCVSEGVRGKKDFWNGVMGGAAAGSVLGVRGAAPQASARMCCAALTPAAHPQRRRCHTAWAPRRRWQPRRRLWTARDRTCGVRRAPLRRSARGTNAARPAAACFSVTLRSVRMFPGAQAHSAVPEALLSRARAGSGGFDDGATPARKYFPYDMVAPKRE
jgi:hypothetical protein